VSNRDNNPRVADPSPRVSVAIVAYQHGDFIATAVESALDQQYDNLHVVVADDNSTDATLDVLADLQRRYRDRLVVVANSDSRSVARNVNRALARCDGDYVVLFDGDDYLLPGKIEAQVAAFAEDPRLNVSFHAAEIFDTDTREITGVIGDPRSVDHTCAADFITLGNFMPLCCTMMRRSAMPARGVHPALLYVGDWILLIETTHGGVVKGIDGVYARYRRHDGAITSLAYRDSPVWRDSLKTMNILEREYPDLAPYCDQGRAFVLRWEAFRRIKGNHAVYALPLLLRALRYQPRRVDLWRTVASVCARVPLVALSRTRRAST